MGDRTTDSAASSSRAAMVTAAVTSSSAQSPPPLSPPPTSPINEWDFLSGWFGILCDFGVASADLSSRDSDDVRVGFDKLNDAWLEVRLHRDALDDRYPENLDEDDDSEDEDMHFESEWAVKPGVLEQLRLLRDAIQITSLVGKTDYAAWLDMMITHAFFDVEPPFKVPVNGELPHIPIQFEIQLTQENNLQFLEWKSCMGHFLGDLKHTNDFIRDLDRVRDVLVGRGIAWQSIAPTPVKIRWQLYEDLYFYDDVSRRILKLIDCIQRTQYLEARAQENEEGRGTLFRIVAIEMDLHCVEMHDVILEALTSLLHVGVRVSRLCLPKLTRDIPSVHQWSRFVRLLTGVDTDVEGRLASVRRIEISAKYAYVPNFAALWSALACSTGVKELYIFAGKRGDDAFTAHPDLRAMVWRWLAFALFSSASTSSVETLYMDGEWPMETDLAAIKKVVDSAHPMRIVDLVEFLSRAGRVSDTSATLHARSMDTIPRRRVFRASDGIRTVECQSDHDLTGELVYADGDSVAFVPGYGFCRGPIAERPEKRARTTEPSTTHGTSHGGSSFRSIVLLTNGQGPETLPQDFLGLLEIIGSQLRGLKFSMDVNDATLKRVFELCPNLESLALTRASLASMDVFEQAYANGATVSSLHLAGIHVPEASLQHFVRNLAVPDPGPMTVAYSLERLRWQFQPSDPLITETLKLLESVLQQNTTLTHLHGVCPYGYRMETVALGQFLGLRIRGSSFKQNGKLLALLSGMRVIAQANPALYVDDHIKQRIAEFAIAPRYRNVCWSFTS